MSVEPHGIPRGDEPARRRRACHHHGRAGRQDRLHRDRGLLGVGLSRRRCWSASTGAATSAPLLAQNGVFCVNTLGAAEESCRRHVRRPNRRAPAKSASTPANGSR